MNRASLRSVCAQQHDVCRCRRCRCIITSKIKTNYLISWSIPSSEKLVYRQKAEYPLRGRNSSVDAVVRPTRCCVVTRGSRIVVVADEHWSQYVALYQRDAWCAHQCGFSYPEQITRGMLSIITCMGLLFKNSISLLLRRLCSSRGRYLPSIATSGLTHLVAMTKLVADRQYDGRHDFDFGLDLILCGLEQKLSRSSDRDSPRSALVTSQMK